MSEKDFFVDEVKVRGKLNDGDFETKFSFVYSRYNREVVLVNRMINFYKRNPGIRRIDSIQTISSGPRKI